ncbi:MAG: hypothetical protein AAGD12_17605, partial [Pseudomonadota bacterium]
DVFVADQNGVVYRFDDDIDALDALAGHHRVDHRVGFECSHSCKELTTISDFTTSGAAGEI